MTSPKTTASGVTWNERYDREDYYYGTDPNDFLKENCSRIRKNGKVLCLAEGEGRNAVFLATQGFQVTAMDGSSVGLEKMQKFAKTRNVTIEAIVSDLAEFEVGRDRWDAIISVWCHLPHELRRQVHSKCIDGLAPGGFFILEAYTPKQLEFKTGGPPTEALLMKGKDLAQELTGLRILLLQEIEREVHEGVGHNGRSAVVQVIAQKL